jgi:anti-sigma factor RsiW
MTGPRHLSEEDLQGAADGSLALDRLQEAHAHLTSCEECAANVARLRTVVMRARETPLPLGSEEDLWSSVRSRIEQSKVARLAPSAAPQAIVRRRPWLAIASMMIAAVLLLAALAELQRWRPISGGTAGVEADIAFANVADSSRIYEAEAKRMLDELEMQRAMMPPSTSASLDDDLRVIDRSIAELTAALARDPHNLALQQLLAASYREKVELLASANNAG